MKFRNRLCGWISRSPLLAIPLALHGEAPPPGIASLVHGFDRMEAEVAELAEGLEVTAAESGQRFVDGWKMGHWLGFKRVAFETGARRVEARVRASAAGEFSVRAGSPEGPEIGRLTTEANEHWQTVEADVWRINGLQPIYMVYLGSGDAQVDWMRFQPEKATAASPYISTEPELALVADRPASLSETSHWTRLEAEDATYSSDLRVRRDETEGHYVSRLRRNSWVMYPKVEYEKRTILRLRVAHQSTGDRLLIRLDERHGEVVAEARLPLTPGLKHWHTVEVVLTGIEPGAHDTYLEFSALAERLYAGVPSSLLEPGSRPTRATPLANLNWIAVNAAQVPETTGVPETALQVAR